MAKQEFVWDYDAAGDLMLRSEEIAEICEAEAAKMTRATGVEYVPDVYFGKTRVNAAGCQNDEVTQKSNDGTEVKGYYRTLKSGKTIYVQSYRRRI